MKITVIEPHIEILTPLGDDQLKFLELAGRVCYKSEDRITDASASKFVAMICKNHHESVLEHVSATVRFVGSRSMSHQLVRHRIASYSQESQRYVNYGKKGYQVVCPPTIGLSPGPYYYAVEGILAGSFYMDEELRTPVPGWAFTDLSHLWLLSRASEYVEYQQYIKAGIPPEDARECLPNASKTEVVATYNLRQWRHIFEERALNKHAQWQIRGLMKQVLSSFGKALPAVFGDQLLQINAEQ